MFKNEIKKEVRKELESLGERLGDRIGHAVSKKGGNKGSEIGKKAGKSLARQVERLADLVDKEKVTREEELGIGGKVGTGLGIIAKHAIEKRYGLLAKVMGSRDLVSEGRATGAKAEKVLKRAVKTGASRLVGKKGGAGQGPDEEI
jgi:hypothetical protein